MITEPVSDPASAVGGVVQNLKIALGHANRHHRRRHVDGWERQHDWPVCCSPGSRCLPTRTTLRRALSRIAEGVGRLARLRSAITAPAAGEERSRVGRLPKRCVMRSRQGSLRCPSSFDSRWPGTAPRSWRGT